MSSTSYGQNSMKFTKSVRIIELRVLFERVQCVLGSLNLTRLALQNRLNYTFVSLFDQLVTKGIMRIAVIGSGISGLSAAHRLTPKHQVTLFESASTLGGHTNTVDLTLDGISHPVDTGFLVFNERTYPNLIQLFETLEVRSATSEMSFSVSIGPHKREWAGSNLGSLFAQPSLALSPRFWLMLKDILRFNTAGTRIAALSIDHPATVGDFLSANRYSQAFKNDYLLPMAAAIWSCSTEQILKFPMATFTRFCHNHGLMQITNRPQWRTVAGGARQYVQKIKQTLQDVRVETPVLEVKRIGGGVQIRSPLSTEQFDAVVMACHSNQSLQLLTDASLTERSVLQRVKYQPNRAVLHTDKTQMPKRPRAWAAWNYLSDGSANPSVSVTYWLNRLQPLPFRRPVFVTLNPLAKIDPAQVIQEFDYEHPLLDAAAIQAQRDLHEIQGQNHVWFAGAWTGYGFHEDGLRSGIAAAAEIDLRFVASNLTDLQTKQAA
jgi:uncharacterized protein